MRWRRPDRTPRTSPVASRGTPSSAIPGAPSAWASGATCRSSAGCGWRLIVLGVVAGLINHSRHRARTVNKSVIVFSAGILSDHIPLLLMSGLAWLKPKFAPRYLLPSLPAFITLASIGITTLDRWHAGRAIAAGRRSGWRSRLALPLASIGSLLQLYTDPSLARPDVRSVVRYIEDSRTPVGCDPADRRASGPGVQSLLSRTGRPSFRCRPICSRRLSRRWTRGRCRSSSRSCRRIRACGWCCGKTRSAIRRISSQDTLVADEQTHQRGR